MRMTVPAFLTVITLLTSPDAFAAYGRNAPNPVVGFFVIIALLVVAYKGIARLIGEELAVSIASGVGLSFLLATVPITVIGVAHLLLKFNDFWEVIGWAISIWCVGCVVFVLNRNWPAIKAERDRRSRSH